MAMIVVLHPEQVREILQIAADLDVDPEVVLADRFGPGVVIHQPEPA